MKIQSGSAAAADVAGDSRSSSLQALHKPDALSRINYTFSDPCVLANASHDGHNDCRHAMAYIQVRPLNANHRQAWIHSIRTGSESRIVSTSLHISSVYVSRRVAMSRLSIILGLVSWICTLRVSFDCQSYSLLRAVASLPGCASPSKPAASHQTSR